METREQCNQFYQMLHYLDSDEHHDIVALYALSALEAPLQVLQYKVDRMLGRVESNSVYD